ncbi:hypothetical protein NYP18_09150 [Corynebacterium sp. YIM 101645]|uniref:Terminase n=1 Tax=Corynebacterium lemuris TaxID=1859292 RepID=A0ABT2FYG8_9CORY|nr:terminase family protein [Corynebacterium lemuris]MCS5479825.1 hypothetical protein [Corynebacterium lemuris]
MTLLGVQEPRLSLIPDGDRARGDKAVEFARWCGLTLYPWQEEALRCLCITDEKNLWAAREALFVVARQNGKGEVLVARELAGIYLFGEKEIFHSAHFMDTAVDAQKRLWEVIEDNDDLMYWWEDDEKTPGVPHMGKTNGKENITFPNGAIVYFRTRTKKTGRGLSVELLILDECFDLPKETYASLSKLTRAQENAQTIYISSPVNMEEHAHGAVFSAKRWAAIDKAPRMLFMEWSPDEDDDPFAQSTWAKCNPSMVSSGPGAQLVDIEADARAAQNSEALLEAFLVETLAQGNWYPRDGAEEEFIRVLDVDQVETMVIDKMRIRDLVGLTVVIDADPGRAMCSVSLAGRNKNTGDTEGMVGYHGALVTADVVGAILQLCDKVDPEQIIVDPRNPAKAIGDALDRQGIVITWMSFGDVKAATGEFLQGEKDGTVKFVDTDGLIDEAFEHAELKADAEGGVRWVKQHGIICQLTSLTYALWGARGVEETIATPHRPPPTAPVSIPNPRAAVRQMQF